MKATRVTIRFDLPKDAEVCAGGLERSAMRRIVRDLLETAARALVRPGLRVALDVLVTDDQGIRSLNREFRGMDRATDALSFPQFSAEEAWEFWADAPPLCFAGKRGRGARAVKAEAAKKVGNAGEGADSGKPKAAQEIETFQDIADLGARGEAGALPLGDLAAFGEAGAVPLGDLVLSLSMIQRQARRARLPLEREMRFVLAHGFLHLMGCDHNTSARRQDMWRLGWRIVRAGESARGARGKGAEGPKGLKGPKGPKKLQKPQPPPNSKSPAKDEKGEEGHSLMRGCPNPGFPSPRMSL